MPANTKLNIAIVGPVVPFRGGIAQHTSMLHRALKPLSNLTTLSFRRQYPAWLFPGKSNLDPDYQQHQEPGVEYVLDSLNPLTWESAVERLNQAGVSHVIFPWWTVFWAPMVGYMRMRLRAMGIQVGFHIHNAFDHESHPFKGIISRRVISNADFYISHSSGDLAFARYSKQVQTLVHPHPVYDQFPKPKGLLAKRGRLELLFYGFVRQYKGVDTLIDALGLLRGDDVHLVIAGEFWGNEENVRSRVRERGVGGQIDIESGFVGQQRTAELFSRADVVVLPYRSASASGIIPLAYHYGTPVISTSTGSLPDVVLEGKTGFLVPVDDPLALAAQIQQLSRAEANAMRADIQEYAYRHLSWDTFAHRIVDMLS